MSHHRTCDVKQGELTQTYHATTFLLIDSEGKCAQFSFSIFNCIPLFEGKSIKVQSLGPQRFIHITGIFTAHQILVIARIKLSI